MKSPNNVLVLFNKVNAPPSTQPPTAFWHFGWHVTDVHKSQEMFAKMGAQFLPLYTGDKGGTVFASSDTWPGSGGVLGLTRSGIAEAKEKGVKPAGGAGFAYLRGPDDAIIEYQGKCRRNGSITRTYAEQPHCAQLWYQQHLNELVPVADAAPGDAAHRSERSG